MCRTIKILISNWPRTQKFSQGRRVAFAFAHHGHVLVTLYVQFLCSDHDWSTFDRWVHTENLCSILNFVWILSAEADRVLCQLVMFLTDFFHWMYKMKFSCYQESSILFMACLFIGFLVEKYVTCQSRKSDFGWHCFRFSACLMRKKGWKVWNDTGFTFQELHLEW